MTIQQISRTANESQDWLCNGVPESTVDTQGASVLYVGDFIKDTQTNNMYQVLTAEQDPNNFGVYINVTYQMNVTNSNINSVLYKSEGNATLSVGSATISCPSLASGDLIQLFYKTPSATAGALFVFSVTPGTGFTVKSTNVLDDAEIGWKVLN